MEFPAALARHPLLSALARPFLSPRTLSSAGSAVRPAWQ